MVIGCLKNTVVVWMIKYPKEDVIYSNTSTWICFYAINVCEFHIMFFETKNKQKKTLIGCLVLPVLELIFKCQQQF